MKFRFEQSLAMDRKTVFKFHETPANLVLLMAGWSGFRMVEHEDSIQCGSIVRVAERVGPFWMPMTFEHYIFEPPSRFGERQMRGPFSKCEHIHEFVDEAEGTTIIDHLDLELPFWLGGDLAIRMLVAPKLRRMFAFREKAYMTLLKSGIIAAKTS